MKRLIFIIILLSGKLVYAQQDTLIRHALSDKSNFEIMGRLKDKHKMPTKFFVFDTTKSWNEKRFYLQGFGTGSDKAPNDEHHPYYHSYLFKDSVLNAGFSLEDKERLARTAGAVK